MSTNADTATHIPRSQKLARLSILCRLAKATDKPLRNGAPNQYAQSATACQSPRLRAQNHPMATAATAPIPRAPEAMVSRMEGTASRRLRDCSMSSIRPSNVSLAIPTWNAAVVPSKVEAIHWIVSPRTCIHRNAENHREGAQENMILTGVAVLKMNKSASDKQSRQLR